MSDDKPAHSSDSSKKSAHTIAAKKPVRGLDESSDFDPEVEKSFDELDDYVAEKEKDGSFDSLSDFVSSETLKADDSGSLSSLSSSSASVINRSRKRDTMIGLKIEGRYTILEKLGQGGMSEVFIARHELLRKKVALKVLREDLAMSQSALERFHREAIAAAAIGDPHIVDVTDYGFTEEGDAFIVMELLAGQDLRKLIRDKGALSVEEASWIAKEVLLGLKAAHNEGIIHRDLKAENIFVAERSERSIKLLDFGISKLKSFGNKDLPSEGLTSTGIVMGTPQYIAPEQAHAESDIDHRVDIYAMGVILYEMLTGELPFSGKTALEVMMKHVQDRPLAPSKRRPDLAIPKRLEKIALKALEKERDKRFDDAQEMLDAIVDESKDLGTTQEIHRSAGRRRERIAVVLGLFLVVLAGGFIAMRMMPTKNHQAVEGNVSPSITEGGAAVAPKMKSSPTTVTKAELRLDAAVQHDRANDRSPKDLAVEVDAKTARKTVIKSKLYQVKLQVIPAHAVIYLNQKKIGVGTIELKRAKGTRLRFRMEAKGYQSKKLDLVIRSARLKKTIHLNEIKKKTREGLEDLKKNPYGQ